MRILFKKGSTLTDLSVALRDYKTGSATVSYEAGDAFYIGNDVPMNHFFIKFGGVVNLIAAVMTIEYWDGKEWQEVVEVTDETNAFSSSNFVQFVPQKDKSWDIESTNYRGEQVTDLEDIVIYDQYWMKITFNVTLTPSIVINWIGNVFCDDIDLYGEYPIFNSSALLTGFESGKTTWEEQRVIASNILVKDLKSQGVIFSAGQILARQDYRYACVHKTAQIILNGMGDDYKDDLLSAKNEYKERLDLSIQQIDRNNNGILDEKEKVQRTGFLSR